MTFSPRFEHLFTCATEIIALVSAAIILRLLCWYIWQPELFAALIRNI